MRDITQKLDGRRIALAVIDHIVSTTAIVVPVKRVIEMMRSVTTSAFSLLRVVDIAFFVPFIHVF